ncbi:hypothetical protein ACTWLI_15665 [Arthrobacter sp. Hor0625]|uniref:hypothetical protein n=1 Tax=Arthrobacter sp. Hor0625 TaxID=3457358 RepID=UPI00403EA94C
MGYVWRTPWDALAADNEDWAASVDKYVLRSPVREVLAEVSSTLGEQTPMLCVGGRVNLPLTEL